MEWKSDFLELEDGIEKFQKKYDTHLADDQGNVARLLNYHLDRCRELLWAEINGGLDEEYQDEVDSLAERAQDS